MDDVKSIGCGERLDELGVERAPAGEPQDLGQGAQPKLAAAGDGGRRVAGRLPPTCASHPAESTVGAGRGR